MALTDSSTRIRTGEELDASRIDPYLKANIPGLVGEPAISQFPGGASNLTYLVRYANRDLILRRPPFGHIAKSAHDVVREAVIMRQLKPVYPKVPEIFAICEDNEVIGAPFYVMEFLEAACSWTSRCPACSPPSATPETPAPAPKPATATSPAGFRCLR